MISRAGLSDIAKRTGLTLYQQEKDYLIKLFLYNYFKRYASAVFKGGTCLRYLYGTERFSEDIDFNITIPPSRFATEVKKVLDEVNLVGIKNGFIKKERFKEAFTCEIWFYGPLYKGTNQTQNKFRIDAGKRGGIIKEPRWELISSEYPETREHFLIQTMDEQELLAEKLKTLFERGKGRDLYDVWFLIKKDVKINLDLFHKKGGEKPNLKKIPSEKEYERDMKKLSNRMIPYTQIKGDLRRVI
jgi:predicted nucleotidyltransferase component of viral defense system